MHLTNDDSITIAVPVYNEMDKIDALIDNLSVIKLQNPLEILICDDGSTDRTWEYLERCSRKYNNVRLLRHANNRGRPAARNTLIENVKTTWLTWLDADDIIHPDKLRLQMYYLKRYILETGDENILATCMFSWRVKLTDNYPLRERVIVPDVGGDICKKLLDGRLGAYLWLLIGKTEVWKRAGGFDETLPRLQDLDFMIRLVSTGVDIICCSSKAPLIIYCKDYSGRSASDVKTSWYRLLKKHRKMYLDYGMRFFLLSNSMMYKNISRFYANNGNKFIAVYYRILSYIFNIVSPYELASRVLLLLRKILSNR